MSLVQRKKSDCVLLFTLWQLSVLLSPIRLLFAVRKDPIILKFRWCLYVKNDRCVDAVHRLQSLNSSLPFILNKSFRQIIWSSLHRLVILFFPAQLRYLLLINQYRNCSTHDRVTLSWLQREKAPSEQTCHREETNDSLVRLFSSNIATTAQRSSLFNSLPYLSRLIYSISATVLMIGILLIYCCIRRQLSSLSANAHGKSNISKMIIDEAVQMATARHILQINDVWLFNSCLFDSSIFYSCNFYCSSINRAPCLFVG